MGQHKEGVTMAKKAEAGTVAKVDDGKVQFSVRITPELRKAIKIGAITQMGDTASFIEYAVNHVYTYDEALAPLQDAAGVTPLEE